VGQKGEMMTTYDHIPKSELGSVVKLRGNIGGTVNRDLLRLPSGEVVTLDRSMGDASDTEVVLEGKLMIETSTIPSDDLPGPKPANPAQGNTVKSFVLRNVALSK
jgi:hypothetical protein